MLILGRKVDEDIYITAPNGEVIYIKITDIRHCMQVKIGIQAPIDYKIARGDVKNAEVRRRNNNRT